MDPNQIVDLKTLHANTLEDLAKVKEQYMQTVKEKGKELLQGAFSSFFKANPDVETVSWTQYTPHFNDGDACTFSRHDFNFRIKGISETPLMDSLSRYYDDDEAKGWYSSWGIGAKKSQEAQPKLTRALVEAAKNLNKQMQPHEDLFEMTFGDHVRVVATAEKFTVEDYDHD